MPIGSRESDPIGITSLPFTCLIYFYADFAVSREEKGEIGLFLANTSILIRYRDVAVCAERDTKCSPLAFISHDSRDKESIARPIALRLQRMLCPVWYDEFS